MLEFWKISKTRFMKKINTKISITMEKLQVTFTPSI